MNGEPYLMINSNAGETIDHLLVVSDVAPSYAPPGKTLLSVSIVGKKDFSDDDLKEKVRAELTKWFGGKHEWRHLKTYKIADALPKYTVNSPVASDLKINEHTFRCGDYAAYPSLNAAMKTGREVAEMLLS
jgi:protoporphyrinogen oxidase